MVRGQPERRGHRPLRGLLPDHIGFKIASSSVQTRDVTLQKADCRLALYEGHLDPARPQLIFWQGDVPAIAADLASKGLTFDRGPSSDDRGPARC